MPYTQFVDTFIDGAVMPPIRHDSPEEATRYATEFSSRRRGEVKILDEYQAVVAVYEEGALKE